MIKTDKREKFIQRLTTSKMQKKKPIEVIKANSQVDKGIEIDKLFNGLKQKYIVGKSQKLQQLKMEFKKFYE